LSATSWRKFWAAAGRASSNSFAPAIALAGARITLDAAAKIYLERGQILSPDFKAKTKAYHEQRLDTFFKSWPDVKARRIKENHQSRVHRTAESFRGEIQPDQL
jgi:hypothetical protein